MIFEAKNYSTRADLENQIKKEVGTDIDTNRTSEHVIKGIREELKRLQLSDMTTVWGIKCLITDSPIKVGPVASPKRGNSDRTKSKLLK